MISKNLLHKNTDFLKIKSNIWETIISECEVKINNEPVLKEFFNSYILQFDNFRSALIFRLTKLLGSDSELDLNFEKVISDCYKENPYMIDLAISDISATRSRDSACKDWVSPFLYYKGFHALQSYRIANWLWKKERSEYASFIQSKASKNFGIDIHPAAKINHSIMLDHGTGIVIGETSVVEENVSIMQSVTLGGTGKETQDRHPKIGSGVLIGAGSKILGNIKIGKGSKVVAGSVVLSNIPPHSLVAGVPATVIDKPNEEMPSLLMNQKPN